MVEEEKEEEDLKALKGAAFETDGVWVWELERERRVKMSRDMVD